MATNAETQITWSSSNSTSVSSGGSTTSDTASLSAGATQASVLVKADNDGTPSDGDEIEMVFVYTVGDPDGASTNEFTTEQHSFSVVLDTFLEDPAIALVQVPTPILEMKLIANNNGSQGITVSGTILDQTV